MVEPFEIKYVFQMVKLVYVDHFIMKKLFIFILNGLG